MCSPMIGQFSDTMIEVSTDATIKLLHGILVTYKELIRFGISDCDKCVV